MSRTSLFGGDNDPRKAWIFRCKLRFRRPKIVAPIHAQLEAHQDATVSRRLSLRGVKNAPTTPGTIFATTKQVEIFFP
jgi:hypothetical protein